MQHSTPPYDYPLLSIIIPAWLMDDELLGHYRRCIAAIRRHTRDVPYELIVIDNGSVPLGAATIDKTADLVLRNATNLGYAPAVNQGFRKARGEYVAVMNDDVIVGPSWADELLVTAGSEQIACPAVMREDTHDPATTHAENIRRVQRERGWAPTYTDLCPFPPRDGFGALWVAGRSVLECLCYRNGDLLDEGYEQGMFEDRDLWLRGDQEGVARVRTHRCWVYHAGNATWAKLPDREAIYARNQQRFLAKCAAAERGELIRLLPAEISAYSVGTYFGSSTREEAAP